MSRFQVEHYYSIYDKIFNNRENGTILLYLIGCYPNSDNFNQEFPIFLRNQIGKPYNVIVFLMDPMYNSNPSKSKVTYKQIENIKFIICPYEVDPIIWNQLLDLSFITYRHNCITIIMEFTGISRKCHNQQIYITPSDCGADTNKTEFNPIIEYHDNIVSLYTPSTNIIGDYNYILNLIKSGNEDPINYIKLEFIQIKLKSRLQYVSRIIRPTLSIMDIPQPSGESRIYSKNHTENINFLVAKSLTQTELRLLLEEWQKSSFITLLEYLQHQTYLIHQDAIFIKYGDEMQCHVEEILWSNKDQLFQINYDLIKHFSN
jgi:hypothetical protein